MKSTQNTNLSTVVKGDEAKLSAGQQKQWSAMVVAKMNQAFKAKSINNILWGDQNQEKK